MEERQEVKCRENREEEETGSERGEEETGSERGEEETGSERERRRRQEVEQEVWRELEKGRNRKFGRKEEERGDVEAKEARRLL